MIRSAPFLLTCYFLVSCFLLKRTSGFSIFTQVTLQVQIIFMAIPFLVAPIFLLILKMPPSPGDSFADRRLIENGNYSNVLSSLLFIILISQFFYMLTVEFFFRYHSRDTIRKNTGSSWEVKLEVLYILVVLAVITLLLSLLEISSPVLFALQKLGATTTCFALVFYRNITASETSKKIFLIFGSTVTILETIGYGFSKAPILALLLSFWISINGNAGISRKRKITVALLLGATIPIIFLVVQTLKLGTETNNKFEYVTSRYPDWFSPSLPFFQRFDLLSSVTDAYYAGVGSWLSFEEYVREIYSALFWNYGFEGLNFGARWAKEVSSKSIAGNAYTGVSLSQGPIAEGYIVGGIIGSVIISVCVVVFTILLCEKSYGNRLIAFIAVDIFAKNSLFEQGLVGNAERFTGAVKVLVIFVLVSGVFGLRNINLPNRS